MSTFGVVLDASVHYFTPLRDTPLRAIDADHAVV
jgi:hypothetical protein